MKNYEINYNENAIIVTKAFLKEAGVYNSEAYNILKGLRTDLPNFEIKQREIKKNSSKKTYGKLTYKRMEEYIIHHIKKNNPKKEAKDLGEIIAEALDEFKTVKEEATFKASPYAYTKKWFLDRYKDFADEAEQTAETAKAELAVVA